MLHLMFPNLHNEHTVQFVFSRQNTKMLCIPKLYVPSHSMMVTFAVLCLHFSFSILTMRNAHVWTKTSVCFPAWKQREERYFLCNHTVPAMPSPYLLSLKHDSPHFRAVTFLEKSVIVSKVLVISFFKIWSHFLIHKIESNIWINIC